jgi:hypothetical protein
MKRFLVLAAAAHLFGAMAMAQSYTPPRTSDGKPDLQGIWQVLNTANWDLQPHSGSYNVPAGPGVVEGDQIPYLPSALAKKQENLKNRATADPLTKCFMAGVPRTMYLPYPFQILQTPQAVVVVSEYVHSWRYVPLYNLPHIDGYEAWMGDSRGRWDGNTLVVETIGLNDETWFDNAGDYHSDALKVTERFTRTAADVIDYEATIDDSKVFSRPWKIKMQLHRRTDLTRVLENECYLNAEAARRGGNSK